MKRHSHTFAAAGALLLAVYAPDAAFAQKPGGILRIPHGDSPASMSTHEEATRSTATPMMGVFNNLVLFDQHVPQNTLGSIVPDLAVAWSWDEDKTALTFQLRQDVRWHDSRPISAKDASARRSRRLEHATCRRPMGADLPERPLPVRPPGMGALARGC